MKKLIIFTIYVLSCNFSIGQTISVSPTRENNVYLGISNPLTIVVENMKCSEFSVFTDNGKIINLEGYDCQYEISLEKLGVAKITILKINVLDTTNLGEYFLRVKPIPLPIAKIAGKRGGYISKNELAVQMYIKAEFENFDFDIHIKILSFSVEIKRNGKSIYNQNIEGSKFTEEVKSKFLKLKKDDIVYFNDIVAYMPDGRKEELISIKFTIL